MPLASPIASSSVAQPAARAEADRHSLPPEMMQEILGYRGPSDLLAFELAQLSPGELTPDVFNRMAHDFIAACEQTWPNQPWPARAIAFCYAWVRGQFEGTDEQFAQSYRDTARLAQILRVCATLDQSSPVELENRCSRRHIPIDGPSIHSPIAISALDQFAFPIRDRDMALWLVTFDGRPSRVAALQNGFCLPDAGTALEFPIVNSMYSHSDNGLLVVHYRPTIYHRSIVHNQPTACGRAVYRPLTNDFDPLPREFDNSQLCARSENDKFTAAVAWSPGESRLRVYEKGRRDSVIDRTFKGLVESVSVDSRGVAQVCVTDEGARFGYEVSPGGHLGPPVPVIGEAPPGYILAPGEDAVILNGPERGDLTLRSRHDGSALILRPQDSACEPQSLCVGPGRGLQAATYKRSDGKQFVGVFDLTSVSGDHAETALPKTWLELSDSASSRSVACLSRDASRLIVAYAGAERHGGGLNLLTVDLSPDGRT